MKNLMFLFIGLATALSTINAQSTTIELDLEEISSIGLSLDAVITLSEGRTQKISIEGPEHLIEDIDTDVRNGSWNIKYETYRNNKVDDQLKIEIQVKSLTHLAVSGVGTIKSKGKFSKVKNRNIAISGKGNISFQGDAEDMHIALSGVGEMDIECHADNMHVALSGSGDIALNGSANYLNMAASGSGNMGGNKLKTKHCKAAISGSSILTAEVSDKLNLTVSGSGVFKYKGNPSIQKKVTSKSALRKI